jgi:sarcosine oxidase subunit alpha
MNREPVQLWVNGASVVVPAGASVAAAIAQALGVGASFRRSRSGTPRAPLCGMGVCFECRVEIDGAPQQRACMTLARAAMRVRTDD